MSKIKRKGFTLIEVILSITLLSIIAMAFLPAITFAYKNLISSEKFTQITFDYQQIIEQEIEMKQELDPTDPLTSKTINVFGTNVKGHVIVLDSSSSSEINVFLPRKAITYITPEIKAPPIIKVEKNSIMLPTQPISIELLNNAFGLYVNEIEITATTKSEFLMNVYRWYLSEEMDNADIPSSIPKDYTVVKEWNEAKKQISYSDSQSLNFIPNIKDKYNRLSKNELVDKLTLTEEELINRFGNRYIRYGVTPYSLAGRIGKEEISNPIYFDAPRIEVEKANFIKDENKFVVYFYSEIADQIEIVHIKLNPVLGEPMQIYRDSTNHKKLIFEFNHEIDQSVPIGENVFYKGSVKSAQYGAISVWVDDNNEGTFIINP